MASFSSGVMISKSEAERRRGDELRMRKQGLDPNRDNKNWGGAVISRRQHKQTRVEKEDEKEREEADSFPLELKDVISKRPDNRLKWLQRALVLAGKKRVKLAAIYDIVQHKKFIEGINPTMAKQMRTLILANLHLFSQKQQRALQVGACRQRKEGGEDYSSDESCSSRGDSRSRSPRRPRSPPRSPRGGRERDSRREPPLPPSSKHRDRRERSREASLARPSKAAEPVRSRREEPGRGAAVSAPPREERRAPRPAPRPAAPPPVPVEEEEDDDEEEEEPLPRPQPRFFAPREESPVVEKTPVKMTSLKMKLQPWQPCALRAAATAPL